MNLDNVQKARLQSIILSPGYEVILDVLEQECARAETELLQVQPEQRDKVLAYHTRAQAFRLLFERFQTAVRNETHQDNPTSDELTVENYKELLNGSF